MPNSFSIFILLILTSCSSKVAPQRFVKSLKIEEKTYLEKNASLIKLVQTKRNGVGNYWKGEIEVTKKNEGYNINLVGEWQLVSSRSNQVFIFRDFDDFGDFIGERALDYDSQPSFKTTCKRDTLNGIPVLDCETKRFYYPDREIECIERRLMFGNKEYKIYEHGNWLHFDRLGNIIKTETYEMGKKIKK